MENMVLKLLVSEKYVLVVFILQRLRQMDLSAPVLLYF